MQGRRPGQGVGSPALLPVPGLLGLIGFDAPDVVWRAPLQRGYQVVGLFLQKGWGRRDAGEAPPRAVFPPQPRTQTRTGQGLLRAVPQGAHVRGPCIPLTSARAPPATLTAAGRGQDSNSMLTRSQSAQHNISDFPFRDRNCRKSGLLCAHVCVCVCVCCVYVCETGMYLVYLLRAGGGPERRLPPQLASCVLRTLSSAWEGHVRAHGHRCTWPDTRRWARWHTHTHRVVRGTLRDGRGHCAWEKLCFWEVPGVIKPTEAGSGSGVCVCVCFFSLTRKSWSWTVVGLHGLPGTCFALGLYRILTKYQMMRQLRGDIKEVD